jgi:hypothetical protein
VRKLSQPVEFRLLEREVRELDIEIDHAQQTLNWESDGIYHSQTLSNLHNALEHIHLGLSNVQSSRNEILYKKIFMCFFLSGNHIYYRSVGVCDKVKRHRSRPRIATQNNSEKRIEHTSFGLCVV